MLDSESLSYLDRISSNSFGFQDLRSVYLNVYWKKELTFIIIIIIIILFLILTQGENKIQAERNRGQILVNIEIS